MFYWQTCSFLDRQSRKRLNYDWMIRQHLPTSNATTMPLTLCSITFSITGFGPLLITVRALAWVTDRTVAALSHGTPNNAASPPMPTKTSKSKWNPEPLTIFLSGLLTIRLLTDAARLVKARECNVLWFRCWANDSRCDLRLQKDQNEDEQARDTACKHHPYRERLVLSERVDNPASFLWVRHRQTFGNH